MSLKRLALAQIYTICIAIAFVPIALVAATPFLEITSDSVACSKDRDPAKVTNLARNAAKEEGISLSRYEQRSYVRYNFAKHEWTVTFFQNLPYETHLPMCVSAYIDDRAKVTHLSTCPSLALDQATTHD